MSSASTSPDQQAIALQRLFVAQAPALRAWLLGVVPDQALADDLVQETFLTVIKKFEEFQPGSNFRAWMFAIARYKLLEACRHHAARAVTLEPEAMELLIGNQPELPVHPDDRLNCLEICLEKLPHRARELIDLRYFGGLRPPDIAARLAWTLNSVNVALSRARVMLRDCIEGTLPRTPAMPESDPRS